MDTEREIAEEVIINSCERRAEEEFIRQNQKLNEDDEEAEVRDGIAETKGKLMKTTSIDRKALRLVPREQNSVTYKKLKGMKSYLD